MRIGRNVIILFVVFIEAVCAFASDFQQKDQNQRTYLSDDFFIQTVKPKIDVNPFSTPDSIEELVDCRAKIRSIMCLVEPAEEGQDSEMRLCQTGGENYAHFFETLFDFFPPVLRQMFCSLDKIFIEKKFIGTAYAGILKDPSGNVTGGVMGIRKSVLDEGLDLATWASWKEQLSYGGVTDSYTPLSHLPMIETSSEMTKVNDFLYFVVAHEFGHILDFTNEINKTKNCPDLLGEQVPPECDMDENSWGGIGWATDRRPKTENDFFNRSFLCFYWCNGNSIASENVPRLYSDLFKTDFISTYATTQPWDDFADSFAYFLMNKNLNTTYLIHTNQGTSYDIMAKLRSPVWNKKFQFLTHFFNRTDVIYP